MYRISLLPKRAERGGAVFLSGMAVTAFLLTGFSVVNAETRTTEIEKVVDKVVLDALKLKPDLDKGKLLYRNCAVCHTPEGWGSPSGRYPQIAGQHKSVILKQLADIHKGNRDNPTMIPFTAPLVVQGAQVLADISAYIEQLPMVPNNSVGVGMRLAKGKKLYEDNCKECHGANGEGDAKEFYPRVHGQHFRYLQRQLHWIRIGKRRNVDKKMAKQLREFSYSEIDWMADYISRLTPDQSLVADRPNWKNPDFRRGFMTAPRGRQGHDIQRIK